MSRRAGPRLTHTLALVAPALLSGACAERRLIATPDRAPTGATWTAVWVAGMLAAVVIGGLLTLPVWRVRGGARLAVAVLSLQSGGVAVAGAVLAAVGVRSWQLVGQPVDSPPAGALLRLSRIDGDGAFLALMVAVVAVVGLLVVTLTAAAARMAGSSDPLERSIASALLAVELGGSGYAVVRLALGAHGLPFAGTALAFPVLAFALHTCWPRRRPT